MQMEQRGKEIVAHIRNVIGHTAARAYIAHGKLGIEMGRDWWETEKGYAAEVWMDANHPDVELCGSITGAGVKKL